MITGFDSGHVNDSKLSSFYSLVVKRLLEEHGKLFIPEDESQLCSEVKAFVKSFILLREVEKKIISEHTEPIEPFGLQEVLKKMLLAKSNHSEVQRYAGGSKERAVENFKKGEVSERDKRILAGTSCSWCGKEKPSTALEKGVESTYCSQACAEEGKLKRGGKL